jgi:hypothetical protein
MLGEQFVEEKGKITGQRVLDIEGPKIETSFSASGKYKGVDASDIGTYSSVPRPGGVLYGEGQGVIMTSDSAEMATWTGQGIAHFIGPGKVRFHGSLFYRTPSSTTGKLYALNNLVGVFEYETDEMGNTSAKVWEWK